MKIHRNAKTTPAARAALVHRALGEGWSFPPLMTPREKRDFPGLTLPPFSDGCELEVGRF